MNKPDKPIVSLGGKFDRSKYSSDDEWYVARIIAFDEYCTYLENRCKELENKRMSFKEKETLQFLYRWAKAGTFENGGRFDETDENTVNVNKAYQYLLRRFGGSDKIWEN